MKKTLLLFLIAVLVASCNDSSKDIQLNNIDLKAKSTDWVANVDQNKLNLFYSCHFIKHGNRAALAENFQRRLRSFKLFAKKCRPHKVGTAVDGEYRHCVYLHGNSGSMAIYWAVYTDYVCRNESDSRRSLRGREN